MKQKIYYLLINFLITCCTVYKYDTIKKDTHYSNFYHLLKDTKDRPDQSVILLKQNTHLWINDNRKYLKFAELLYDIGEYSQSRHIALELLLKRMNFFDRGKIYFLLAKNYDKLGNIDEARYYLDKTLSRNYYYYLYYYANLEAEQKNFEKSLALYQKAIARNKKPEYIQIKYAQTLEKALIYYKNKDKELFDKYAQLAEKNRYFLKLKLSTIKKSIVLDFL